MVDFTPLIVFMMSITASINAWELKQIWAIRREMDDIQREVSGVDTTT